MMCLGNRMQLQPSLCRPTAGQPRLCVKPPRRHRTQAALLDDTASPDPSRDASLGVAAQQLATPQPGGATAAAEGLEQYAALKAQLFRRARNAGAFLAAYLFLQQGSVAATCSGLGSLVGYAYLQLLASYVDGYTGETRVPLVAAQQYQGPFRALVLGFAAYRQALRPRLLLPVGLAAAVGAFNAFSGYYLSQLQEFELLLGFLCYKAGLFGAVYDDLKPKFEPEDQRPAARPSLPELPSLEGEEEQIEQQLRERRRH